LAPEAERLLHDASPLVRGAAVWALGRLLPPDKVAKLAAQYRGRESEAAVQDEWTAMLDDAPRAAEVLA
jgi:epoxyqueuosine reductase